MIDKIEFLEQTGTTPSRGRIPPAVAAYLAEHGAATGHALQFHIRNMQGIPVSKGSVRNALSRMLDEGVIERCGYGLYRLPGREAAPTYTFKDWVRDLLNAELGVFLDTQEIMRAYRKAKRERPPADVLDRVLVELVNENRVMKHHSNRLGVVYGAIGQ